jgi:CelD/BcsL family acetyltransferase involved in cellulose biosynthesis
MSAAAPQQEAGALRVREVTTLEELRCLRSVWDEVFEASETRSPFLSHEWALTWWEVFGQQQDLWVLVLEDERGAAGIAPFARTRRHIGPLTYRALELIGTGALRFLGMGLSDRADFLLARRHEECVAEILRRLVTGRTRWDIADLRFVPEQSTSARVLVAMGTASGLGVSCALCAESPYLPLTGAYEEYLAGRSQRFRKGLKRQQRRLAESGQVCIELNATRGGDVRPCLERIVEVSSRSWKGRNGTALLTLGKMRVFFEKLLPRLVNRDMVYVSLLNLGNRVVAYELGFRWDGKLWAYDAAFDERYARASPGSVLSARVVEGAWAEGLREYDFLRGDHAYKRAWHTESRREVQIVLDTGGPRAVVARQLGYRAKWALKRSPWIVDVQSRLAGRLHRLSERR